MNFAHVPEMKKCFWEEVMKKRIWMDGFLDEGGKIKG
jgi:hypothetical protein